MHRELLNYFVLFPLGVTWHLCTKRLGRRKGVAGCRFLPFPHFKLQNGTFEQIMTRFGGVWHCADEPAHFSECVWGGASYSFVLWCYFSSLMHIVCFRLRMLRCLGPSVGWNSRAFALSAGLGTMLQHVARSSHFRHEFALDFADLIGIGPAS